MFEAAGLLGPPAQVGLNSFKESIKNGCLKVALADPVKRI